MSTPTIFARSAMADASKPVARVLLLILVLVWWLCAMSPPKCAIYAALIGWRTVLPKNWNRSLSRRA